MKLRFNYWLWVGCVFGLLATMFAVSACADAGAAVAQPLVVWTDTPWQALKPDLKPPTNPSQSIKLAAARGGIASGLVLVSGAGGAVQAKAEELKGPGGAIPVRLRYATRKRDLGPTTWGEINGRKLDASYKINGSTNLEALSDTPVADEPLQAVWVTVDVPPDTQAGNYQGNLTVEGKTIDIALSVSDFTIPPLGKRQLYVNIHQSPDSVVFRYNVKPWSDEHFKLLETSMDLAGRAGANILYVPVIGFTYFGQRNGLIVFTRKGEELVPDFTAFDRYLDLWIKHAGKPQLVVLNLWDIYLGGNGWYSRNYLTRQFPIDVNSLEVTVREADGSLKQVRTPLYDKAPETWKALVEGVQQRMAKVGVAKHQVMLGQATDVHVPKATVDFFRTLDPDLRWTAWTHGYGYSGDYGANGNRMGLMTFPDFRANLFYPRGLPIAPRPNTRINLNALRSYLDERQESSILRWRVVPDLSGGYGPVGLDLWPLAPFVPTDEEKSKYWFRQGGAWSLKQDYGPNLDRGQIAFCTVAGPNGALSTTRLEGLAEGACETEARYCVELAARLRQIDVETAKSVINARYSVFNTKVTDPKTGKESAYCDIYGNTPAPASWNESLAALYDLAFKARQALDDPAVLTKIPAELPKLYDEHDLGPQLFAFRYMVDHLPQAESNAYLLDMVKSNHRLREEALRMAVATRPAIEGLDDWMINNARAGNALIIQKLGNCVGSEKAVPILTELLSHKSTDVVREAASALLAMKKNEVQAAEGLSNAFITAGNSNDLGSLNRLLWNIDGFITNSDVAVRKSLVPGLVAVIANVKVDSRDRVKFINVIARLKQDAAPALEMLRKLSTGTDKSLADAATGAVNAIEAAKP